MQFSNRHLHRGVKHHEDHVPLQPFRFQHPGYHRLWAELQLRAGLHEDRLSLQPFRFQHPGYHRLWAELQLGWTFLIKTVQAQTGRTTLPQSGPEHAGSRLVNSFIPLRAAMETAFPMIITALHQLRFILSIAFGRSFAPSSLEHLVMAARQTIDEFGSLGTTGPELIGGITLDADTQQEIQTRRLREAARRAAETPYYTELFRCLSIRPETLTLDTLNIVPVTCKEAVRDCPDDFVRVRRSPPFIDMPVLCATTTGTTGIPTSIYFSQREMRTYFALSALGMLMNRTIDATDIVQISVSARGTLGNMTLAFGASQVGALVYQTGVIAPEQALAPLAQTRSIPGKKAKTSVLYTYPSYLGVLVETGLAQGYTPSDFGLERIAIGGEIVTEGLKARARELFGDVIYDGTYGITELWGMGCHTDASGMLSFDVSQGLLEVIDPDTGGTALPGEIGTIVGTPFPPYRETTLLLRYDTQDLVCAVDQQPGSQRCGPVLGKKRLAVRHADGTWTTPRAVLEVLERCTAVPLPARFALYPYQGGVGIEVVTLLQTNAVARPLQAKFEEAGVPVTRLILCESPEELSQPSYPLRSDLREVTFNDPRLALAQQAVLI